MLELLHFVVASLHSMLGLLLRAWMVLVGWFQPDVPHGVFWGSMLVTFVSSVMGDDQVKRLQNGAFGAAAGTSLGGLAGLLKDQKDLVVVGFVGSAAGGFLGWIYYALLAWRVARNPNSVMNKNFLAFQAGGLQGLREQLDVQSIENLKVEFQDWCDKFARTLGAQKQLLLKYVDTAHWEDYARGAMQGWLVSAADALTLVYGTLSNKTETQSRVNTQDLSVKAQGQSGDQAHSQSRVTIIVFGLRDDPQKGGPQITGMHWICYSGQLRPHDLAQPFLEDSIGNKVRSQQYPSPYTTNFALAGKDGEKRADDASNRPFITFRLNSNAILSVDWPAGLGENAAYVKAARSLFYSVVTPTLTEILERWPSKLAHVVGLAPLPASGSRVAPAPAPASPTPVVSAPGPAPARAPSSPPVGASSATSSSAPASPPVATKTAG